MFLDLDLRQGGIIVNREVQIRPAITAGTGEVTDIHVDAEAIATLTLGQRHSRADPARHRAIT